ncbi:MAG: heat-inducible transcriptional repressor [Chloroflexota bacterium]|nr:heat-inducible transcriptional repressor [Chloroflexota bacterium]
MDFELTLDARKQQILKAVVSDYTETGVPVGSVALAIKHLGSWSSATIRNELSTLVEIGYLLQPHASAGRIPSDRGYRYYVDFLMEEEQVSAAVRRQVDPVFPIRPAAVEELLEAAAMVLALVTDAVSIVTGPRALGARLKHLDVVSLDSEHALLIVLLDGNLLQQHVFPLSVQTDQETLSRISAELNRTLRGLDPGAIEALPPMPGDDAVSATLRAEIVAHVLLVMRSDGAGEDTVVIHDGVRNLLRQPEFGDVMRLRQVLDIVEEERALGQLLSSLDLGKAVQGVHVVIGAEAEVEQLRGCSLVLTTYRAGDAARGTIGVLGPTRMRYSQVSPRVRYVSQRVGQALERLLG